MKRDETQLNSNQQPQLSQVENETNERMSENHTIHSEELRYKNADEIYE